MIQTISYNALLTFYCMEDQQINHEQVNNKPSIHLNQLR